MFQNNPRLLQLFENAATLCEATEAFCFFWTKKLFIFGQTVPLNLKVVLIFPSNPLRERE